MRVALPINLSARSFPFTPACPGLLLLLVVMVMFSGWLFRQSFCWPYRSLRVDGDGGGDVFRMTVPAVFLLAAWQSLCLETVMFSEWLFQQSFCWLLGSLCVWRQWCFQDDCSSSLFVDCMAVFVVMVMEVMMMVLETVMFSGWLFRQSFCWL